MRTLVFELVVAVDWKSQRFLMAGLMIEQAVMMVLVTALGVETMAMATQLVSGFDFGFVGGMKV